MSSLINHFVSRRLVDSDENLVGPDSPEFDPYTSIGFIIWYIVLVLCCFIPMACFCIGFTRMKCGQGSTREAQEELDLEISRMEANIIAFSMEERKRKRTLLLNTLKSNSVVLGAADIDEQSEEMSMAQPSGVGFKSQILGGCSICLAKYEEGDEVVRSSNPLCKHVFHQQCLVQWLESRNDPLCPCCRQSYLEADETGASNIISPDTSSSHSSEDGDSDENQPTPPSFSRELGDDDDDEENQPAAAEQLATVASSAENANDSDERKTEDLS